MDDQGQDQDRCADEATRLEEIEEHLTVHQDIHEDEGWWLVGKVKWLRKECEGLRESIQDWRRSHDVVSGEAQRAKGLEAAARSAFAEVERLRDEQDQARAEIRRLEQALAEASRQLHPDTDPGFD